MSLGLVDESNQNVCIKALECSAEVTNDFGVFTLKQRFCNESDHVVDASYIFPLSNCEIIVDFKVYFGRDAVVSHLIKKRDKDDLEGMSFASSALDKCSFKAHIGKMAPGRIIETEIKYIKQIEDNGRYCKIVIPTVVAPNFIVEHNQYSFNEYNSAPNYDMSLNFTYYGSNITDAVCKTHKLSFYKNNNCVSATLADNSSSNYNIVIEIKKSDDLLPTVYKYNNIIYCSFYPTIDIYNRQGKKYLFMINVGERHKPDIKSAILICLRAMGHDDLFNIIMLSRQNSVFSDDFLNATDENVRNAAHWFDSYELGDSVELFSSVISSYRHSGNTVAMLFSDEKMSQNHVIMNYIKNHKLNSYYPFEIDNKDDHMFLTSLAESTGGKYHYISQGQKVDTQIINAFNIIAAPCITNVSFSFDSAVNSVATTSGMKKIHYGDKIGVTAEIYDNMPQKLYVEYTLSGEKKTICIDIKSVTKGGSSLRYLLAKSTIENLSQILSDCNIKEEQEIIDKIVDISSKYSIYNNFMDMLLMNYNGNYYDCVSIVRPKALPFDWYVSAVKAYTKKQKTDDTETEIIKIIKKQHFDGSFITSKSRSKESIALCTANVLSKICTEYYNPSLFIWQMRKCVLYLMDYINESNNAKIPQTIIKALKDWHNVLHGNDEISQKISALEYMYRDNL